MNRRQNYQSVAWLWDLYKRGLLDLEPPYQRRSVWNQEYRDYFIDTILLQFPAPAIFLFEEIDSSGNLRYHVVDGKQRLITIFDFLANKFPVSNEATQQTSRGKYFEQLDTSEKTQFWGYQFSVEYLPSVEEPTINNIFDRINKNVAKLTPQELRHARLDGVFINACESLADWMASRLPPKFPRLTQKSRAQMKDVELTATLLMLLEEGPKGYSQDDLDEAFVARDESWDRKDDVENRFRRTVEKIRELSFETDSDPPVPSPIVRSRFQNQADFYSLFGAVDRILSTGEVPWEAAVSRLTGFLTDVDDETRRAGGTDASVYYEAARSASNDAGPRRVRMEIIERVLRETTGAGQT